jgi:hypothetical protein
MSDYKERFLAAADFCEHLGDDIEVINPASSISRPNWQWADWMIFDLHLLRGADVLVSLPGSESSPGARTELEFAKGFGIPCVDLGDFRASLVEMKTWKRREA